MKNTRKRERETKITIQRTRHFFDGIKGIPEMNEVIFVVCRWCHKSDNGTTMTKHHPPKKSSNMIDIVNAYSECSALKTILLPFYYKMMFDVLFLFGRKFLFSCPPRMWST